MYDITLRFTKVQSHLFASLAPESMSATAQQTRKVLPVLPDPISFLAGRYEPL